MKSIIHKLTLAAVFAAATSTGMFAQDEPAAEPAQSPPPVESPAPVVESPPPVVESPPPAAEPPAPVVESPPPAAESPAPQPAETSPPPAAVPSEPAEVSRPGRPIESPPAEGGQQGQGTPPGDRPARGESIPDAAQGGNDGTPNVGGAAPVPATVAQSGRSGSGRGQDRPSGGSPQRDDGRRDSGQQRSQLGISIGPGGVQVFRGNPGIGPGPGGPSRNYYDRDRGYRPGNGYPSQFYQNRGWGIAIDTRPQVVVPSGPIIVTEPQYVQPSAPQPPAEPPVPTNDQLAGMPGVDLRGLFLFSVDRLDEQLDGLSTGNGWKSFLKTEELRKAVPPPTLAPLPPESEAAAPTEVEPLMPDQVRRRLSEILTTYERVQQNPEYRQISQLWGFQTVHLVLRELLVPPIQRLRKQLTLSVELLEDELQQFETSSRWKSHLKLDDVKRIASVRPEDISAADRNRLQSIISVFDTVAAEPSYRMISDLLGFRLTQYGARSYLAQLKVPAPPAPPSPAKP